MELTCRELTFNHDEENLARALGLSDKEVSEISRKIINLAMRYRVISKVMEEILVDKSMPCNAKIYAIYGLGVLQGLLREGTLMLTRSLTRIAECIERLRAQGNI